MTAWVGQYCIYVRDLERSVKFYEALGLACTSRTDLDTIQRSDRRAPRQGREAPARAEARPVDDADRHGQRVLEALRRDQRHREVFADSVAGGSRDGDAADAARPVAHVDRVREGPRRLPRRVHPAPPVEGRRQHHLHVARPVLHLRHRPRALDRLLRAARPRVHQPHRHPRTRKPSSRTPSAGGKLQLAQQLDNDAPIDMGTSMWKLYVNTDGCEELHRTAVAAGHTSLWTRCHPTAGRSRSRSSPTPTATRSSSSSDTPTRSERRTRVASGSSPEDGPRVLGAPLCRVGVLIAATV